VIRLRQVDDTMATEWTMETIKEEMVKVCPSHIHDNTQQMGQQIYPHAIRLAYIYFNLPAGGQQPPATQQKINDLTQTLINHQYDRILKAQWNTNVQNICSTLSRRAECPPVIVGGLWTHESKISELMERVETLEKTNQTLTLKDNKLSGRVETLEKTNQTLTNKLSGRVETLEKTNQTLTNKLSGRLETLEKTNQTLTNKLSGRVETLEKTNQTLTLKLENESKLEKKLNTLAENIEDLETSVRFLKNRNTILERNCVIYNSISAFLFIPMFLLKFFWNKSMVVITPGHQALLPLNHIVQD
jgi:hypothetical protein